MKQDKNELAWLGYRPNNYGLNWWSLGTMIVTIGLIMGYLRYCGEKQPEPIQPTYSQFESVRDNLKREISQNRIIIDSLFRVKSENKKKIKKYYIYFHDTIHPEQTLFDEVLWEHGSLDDTAVTYEGERLVLFRLIQGLEARGNVRICEIQLDNAMEAMQTAEYLHQSDSMQIDIMARAAMLQAKDIAELQNKIEQGKVNRKAANRIWAVVSGAAFGLGVWVGVR